MKVFHEKDYKYIGQREGWHCFQSIKEDFDPEIVAVYRARMIKKDGSSVYFDPIFRRTVTTVEITQYRFSPRSEITSMCVIDPAKVKRKPKWKVAESNESVRFIKVSP